MKVLTKESVAQIMGVSKRTIDNWMALEILPPPTHIGRRCYWHPQQFEAWLNSQFQCNGIPPGSQMVREGLLP